MREAAFAGLFEVQVSASENSLPSGEFSRQAIPQWTDSQSRGLSIMKSFKIIVTMAVALCFGSLSAMWAAPAKTYQVTGPILELTDTTIVVQKGDERWAIARDEATKGAENLKIGDKVTIHYRMTATRIESKGPASEEKQKGKKP
jgi:hypothetical protein